MTDIDLDERPASRSALVPLRPRPKNCVPGCMDRALLSQHLALAERHVAQGEGHVRRQRELVESLARGGHDTRAAEYLLREFEEGLASHKADLDRIRTDLARAD